LIEPWPTTFFHRPEAIRGFLDSVGHPRVGLHLDQMNMVSPDTYFHTTELIETTFDLLADDIGSVHLKDVYWDPTHMLMKLDEVLIGDGVLDYETLLRHLAALDGDLTCYCEHLPAESLYAVSFERLHRLADEGGTPFIRRTAP